MAVKVARDLYQSKKIPSTPMIFLAISVLFLAGSSDSALPTCSQPGCPPGGLWSEWVTKESCSTSCGSCSSLFYTRSCMSSSAGCDCSGPTSGYSLCNTQTCLYPAQRTCCIPYVSMLINGSFQCGPFPKSTETTQPCCPQGGLWSEWSNYARNAADTEWIRTRSCVSEDFGCSCPGDAVESRDDCPCRALETLNQMCPGDFGVADTYRYSINDTTCILTYKMEATNSLGKVCSNLTTWTTLNYVAHFNLLYVDEPRCTRVRAYYCDSTGSTDQTVPVTFTCDLDSLYWIFDATSKRARGFAQIKFAD